MFLQARSRVVHGVSDQQYQTAEDTMQEAQPRSQGAATWRKSAHAKETNKGKHITKGTVNRALSSRLQLKHQNRMRNSSTWRWTSSWSKRLDSKYLKCFVHLLIRSACLSNDVSRCAATCKENRFPRTVHLAGPFFCSNDFACTQNLQFAQSLSWSKPFS